MKAAKIVLLLLLAAGAGILLFRHGRIPQPESYHAFADTRTMQRIPNALNVLSNIPFALVGLLGIFFLGRGPTLDPMPRSDRARIRRSTRIASGPPT